MCPWYVRAPNHREPWSPSLSRSWSWVTGGEKEDVVAATESYLTFSKVIFFIDLSLPRCSSQISRPCLVLYFSCHLSSFTFSFNFSNFNLGTRKKKTKVPLLISRAVARIGSWIGRAEPEASWLLRAAPPACRCRLHARRPQANADAEPARRSPPPTVRILIHMNPVVLNQIIFWCLSVCVFDRLVCLFKHKLNPVWMKKRKREQMRCMIVVLPFVWMHMCCCSGLIRDEIMQLIIICIRSIQFIRVEQKLNKMPEIGSAEATELSSG
jgi:hypothetical protein